jgi:hypothetical protein
MKLWKSLEAQEIQGFFALGRADRKDMALDRGNVILAPCQQNPPQGKSDVGRQTSDLILRVPLLRSEVRRPILV